MRAFKSEVAKIKNDVLREIAYLAFNDKLEEEIDQLPRKLINAGNNYYRCCIYKERAVLSERAKYALGFSPKELDEEVRLGDIVKNISEHEIKAPVLDIIDIACDRCPIDKYLVTDACRGCVAHYCVNACSKDAITIVGRKAYIDQEKCIECGRCAKACHFHAIVEVHRPCERACPAQAIRTRSNRNSAIDDSICTSCGECITSCPFGAVTDKSMMTKVIKWIKEGKNVVAALAPAVAGQFGRNVEVEQVLNAAKELGFTHTAEVALAADEVALEEAKEFYSLIDEKKWLASSCCPAFVDYIKKHFPDLKDHIAPTPSPMVMLGRNIKREHPDYKVVFVGPCVAKKKEALSIESGIDAVLTFEELSAMFEAKDIDLVESKKAVASFGEASPYGRGFAVSGGVTKALQESLEKQNLDIKLKPVKANGLEECKRFLTLARVGKLPGNFLEGMACEGGCIGGPATLVGKRKAERAVKEYMNN